MHYKTKKSTIHNLEDTVIDVGVGFGSQVLDTFHGAFTFTLGLLTHELVREWSQKKWENSTFFSWLIFMIIGFVMPRIKHFYHRIFDSTKDDIVSQPMAVSTSVSSRGVGSAHQSYYKS
jgi:hypothetical protein